MPEGPHPMTESPATASPGDDLARALADPSAAWPDVVLREHQIEALDELAGRLTHGTDADLGGRADRLGQDDHVPGARRRRSGAAPWCWCRGATWPSRPPPGLARHFTAVPSNPEGPDAAGKPGVTVCTYQAALRHQDRMDWDSVTLLICDEAHATLGAQTRKLLDRARNAVVVGFTATGATTTGHVEQVFGPVAATLDRASAIERGILCPLRSLRVERAVDLSDVARVRGDFDQASLGRALDRARWHRACAEVWVEHFQPLKLAGRGLHRDGRPGARAGRGAHRARRARRGGVGTDAPAGAPAGALRLRLRPDRRALQRRPADGGLGRDARRRGDAPRADHLRARLRAAPRPGDAPGARQGGGVGRVPPGRRSDGRADQPRRLRARLVQAARPRGRPARGRGARQARQGGGAAGRPRRRLGQAGQPRRGARPDRRRASPTAAGARPTRRSCR